MGSQWSCLRRSVDVSEQEREDCCVTTLALVVLRSLREQLFQFLHTELTVDLL